MFRRCGWDVGCNGRDVGGIGDVVVVLVIVVGTVVCDQLLIRDINNMITEYLANCDQ